MSLLFMFLLDFYGSLPTTSTFSCKKWKTQIELTLKIKGIYGFPGGLEDKASVYSAGDLGLIPGLGTSPGEGNGSSLQYSCLENPMDDGAW